MSHPIQNTIDKIIEERKQSNAQLQNMASDLLASISKIQKIWDSNLDCIADQDTPCDCPKCIINAATMKAEEDEEECEHDEHDHGYCLDCGEDVLNDLVGRSEDSLNEDR